MKKYLLIQIFVLSVLSANAITKELIKSGNWNDPQCWNPHGVPSSNDEVILSNNYNVTVNSLNSTCRSLVINSNSELSINLNSSLAVNGISGINISGTLTVNGAINCSTYGSLLKINNSGKLIWNPQNNNQANANIFTNCIEDFDIQSSVCIKKWFDNKTGFGQYVSGSIGNLSIENIPMWNMMNTLESHSVKGKLSIKNSYVTLDSTSSIQNTYIGEIELLDANSILDIYSGKHENSFSLTTNKLIVNGGQFTLLNKAGEGNSNLIINNDLTVTNMGIFTGSYGNDGNIDIYVGGKILLNKSYFYGCYVANGNFKLNVNGDIIVQKSGAMFSEFHGIYNGTGNVDVNINGNFNHQGYSDLILNDGINGVGTGNAKINIHGKFQQSSGDFRCIYNLTSYDAGSINMECNEVDFDGGIFIMYYACSNQNLQNSFTVRNSTSINFTNNNDVFRFNGLSNLNGTNSNCKLKLELKGPITIEGNNTCELNTNASFGEEYIFTNGNILISGGGLRINYSDHNSLWDHTGNLEITSGTNNFSANTGNSTININGNLVITGGATNLKSNNGNSVFTLKGNFHQSGGNLIFYNNLNNPLYENISINVEGDFTQTNGSINFNTNILSSGKSSLNIKGENYKLEGGSLFASNINNYNYFGEINFTSSKIIKYSSINSHSLHQIKQTIKPNTSIDVATGDFKISSGINKSFEYLKIDSNATIELNEGQIIGAVNNQNTGVYLSNFATLKIKRKEGFYNSSGTAALNSQSGMDYFLSPFSNIVYCGTNTQIVTNNLNNDNIDYHRYGNLIIDKINSSNCSLGNNEITIRNQLVLRSGELNIADQTLIIENGNTDAIINQNGFINCGLNASNIKGNLIWKNISAGRHNINFGEAEDKITPLAFSVKSGIGNAISISTNSTSIFNTPYPISNNNGPIQIDNTQASNQLIDRTWYINSSNTIMDIEYSYLGGENTTTYPSKKCNFSAKLFTNGSWSSSVGTGRSTTNGVGYVKAMGITCNGAVILCENGKYPNVRFDEFSAKLKGSYVELDWSTLEEEDCNEFVIERSSNNIDFEKIETVDASGNSTQEKSYKSYDNNPLKGISFYRIRNNSNDGNYAFTECKIIDNGSDNSIEVFPIPFTNDFTAEYNCDKKGSTTISIINSIGQTMYLTQRNDEAGKNTFQFSNSSKLKPGTYFLNVISGTKKITKKIIKSTY